MTNISPIGDISRLYANAGSTEITQHVVHHGQMRCVLHSIQTFIGHLGDHREDEYWTPYLRWLRRFRFLACSIPLPAGHPEIFDRERFTYLKSYLARSAMVFPQASGPALLLLKDLNDLAIEDPNPLLDALASLVSGEPDAGTLLIVKEPRLIPAVTDVLTSVPPLAGVTVVSAADLRRSNSYDRLVVFGPAHWYPSHVFAVPRASSIRVIRYAFNRDYWKPEKVFIDAIGHRATHSYTTESVGHEADLEDVSYDANREVLDDLQNHVGQIEDRADSVDARILILSQEHLVYLDASEGASVLVIDVDESEVSVDRVSVSDVEPGMYVLLRTEGGGDYVVPVADRILGNQASRCREVQRYWKRLLRAKVQARDLLTVSIQLLDLGSVRANEQNVRNWMSDRSIRTNDYADFLALMKLLQLENEAEEYWRVMGTIRRAHQQAGRQIRSQLLQQVANIEITKLEREGRMDFELGDEGGGRLTCFRVEQGVSNLVSINPSRLAHPFKIDRHAWPG